MAMTQFAYRALLIFLGLLAATSLMVEFFGTPFGTVDFFKNHSYLFLFFITLFPRLTLLFSNVAFGGVFWWIGFLFVPRLLVAVLATVAYFKTNPVLVVISWMVALSGEVLEKRTIGKRSVVFHYSNLKKPQQQPHKVNPDGVIETEGRVL
jgi:hypothetical protein